MRRKKNAMDPDNDEDKKEEVRSMLGDRAAELVEDEAGGKAAASGSTDAERSVRDED
ncbi:MAG: hypothetical protein SVS85_03210 [Candidatus Nanohaloarchaea archaeon]|nr:hypothetical protein [Candidatus Nanohaloarchaea archaeon]